MQANSASPRPEASQGRAANTAAARLTAAVLQLAPRLDGDGIGRDAVDMARHLRARGWRALVASPGGAVERELAAAGGTHLPLPLDVDGPRARWRNAAGSPAPSASMALAGPRPWATAGRSRRSCRTRRAHPVHRHRARCRSSSVAPRQPARDRCLGLRGGGFDPAARVSARADAGRASLDRSGRVRSRTGARPSRHGPGRTLANRPTAPRSFWCHRCSRRIAGTCCFSRRSRACPAPTALP